MKFTMKSGGDGNYDVPVGEYIVKFKGVRYMEPQNPPMMGRDGKPMEPGMAWDFVIEGGPHNGKETGRITGRSPSTKNSCGRFLRSVTSRFIKDGDEVDLDPFIGKHYRVIVEPTQDGQKTRVSDNPGPISVAGPTQATPAAQPQSQQPAASSTAPAGPPPRRQAPTQSAKPERFWVAFNPDADPVLMTREEIQATFNKNGSLDPRTIDVCKENGELWEQAHACGFQPSIPW